MPQNYPLTFFRQNPFVRLLAPLIIGILTGRYFAINNVILDGVFIVCLLFALGIFYKENYWQKGKRYSYWFAIFVYLGIFSLGADLIRRQNESKNSNEELIENTYVKAVVLESPKETKWGRETIAQLKEQINYGETLSLKSKVKIYIEDSLESICAGDILLFPSSKLKRINSSYSIPYQFNYNQYLIDKGIYYTAGLNTESWVKHGSILSIYTLAQELRHTIINKFQDNGLTGQALGIVSALALGDKQFLDKQIKSDYAGAGAMHVLAVSGLHIGIVYMLLNYLVTVFTRRERRKLLETIFIVLGIWFFAFISGLSVSVIRSAIMFTILAIGGLFKRNVSIYNTIAFSAFVLLLYNPTYLFDVGFQLSFIAVLGIVVFYPTVNNWFVFKSRIMTAIWELTAVSITAQIVTLPLVIYSFHQIPLYGILTNLFVIYLASILLMLTLVSVAFVWWMPIFKFLLLVIEFVADVLNYLTSLVAHLPMSVLDGLYIDLKDVLLLYVGIIALLLYTKTRKKGWLPLAQVTFILFLGLIHYENYRMKTSTCFTVEKSGKELNLNILKDGVNLLYTTEQNPKRLNYLLKKYENYWKAHHSPKATIITLQTNRNYFLDLDKKKYAIVNTLEGKNNLKQADCLILNGVGEEGFKFPNGEYITMNPECFVSLDME